MHKLGKRSRVIALFAVLLMAALLPTGVARGQMGPTALAGCAEFGFSTEEDFLTQGPEPSDGNPVISDGDLLGPGGMICARNADLLHNTFDVAEDLGLDAADVLDVDKYLVAFSTELDSPNRGQFTAGDLLLTNGTVIPNIALTHLFLISYDIGLDAVHFVGTDKDISTFLAFAAQHDWRENPGVLPTELERHNVDIWFSIEGTFRPPVGAGGVTILDGDLLSAAGGFIVAPNADLLPLHVPAGIPNRGVDFGLDAATTTRAGDKDLIHFSTEILYNNEMHFTDGDVLAYDNGVVATNLDLIKPFEPKARELGLDALSVNIPITRPCVSRITHIAGVPVADIGPDGLAMTNTVGSPLIPAPIPFGGEIDISGNLCDDVDEFRLLYRLSGSGGSWTSIGVPAGLGWKVKVDAFMPPGPDCLGSMVWHSDGVGWYGGADYRHLTDPLLLGCNPGLALTVWDSENAVDGADELYELVLVTDLGGGTVITSTATHVQLDNTMPEADLDEEWGTCDAYTQDDMPLMVRARITDTHFHRYRLQITGDYYGTKYYTPVAYYDDTTDNVIADGTVNRPLFDDLHAVTVFDLAASPIACGYTVRLTAWERTLWTNFSFPGNQAYRHPAWRHTSDAWTFNYTP